MSLAVRVIPCLDVDAGRVVKGVHFENLRDAGDPVELAAEYYRQGADELTFLDVTASSSHRQTMVDVVSRTALRSRQGRRQYCCHQRSDTDQPCRGTFRQSGARIVR